MFVNRYRTRILFGIVLLAAILRLWQLGHVPISPDWDEVALGYNAYSVLQTGKDEYGKQFPFILQSYDDYKPALYMYLSMPFIFLFGLSVVAVRLPSAIVGILAVLATYFLVRELMVKRETTPLRSDVHRSFAGQAQNHAEIVSLLSTFLLAISPWHLQFSRVAFEASVGMAFNLFGALFFLKGLRKPWYFILSALFFSLNLYVYQSEKVFTPLFVLLLIAIFFKPLLKIDRRYLFGSFLVGLFVSLPILYFTLTNQEGLQRAKGVSVLKDATPLLKEQVVRLERDQKNNNYLGLLLDNRRVEFSKIIFASYFSHFDFNWLFIRGDAVNRHHAPGMGLLYVVFLPFLLIGIYTLSADKGQILDKKKRLFIFLWFILVPIPASITTGVPHAVRTINFLPLFDIFAAVGLVATYGVIMRSNNLMVIKAPVIGGIIVVFIFNFLYFLNQYFAQQNYFYAKDWQYGYKEMVAYLKPRQQDYEKILVSSVRPMDQSYMFFLFYLQYDPAKYLAEGGTQSSGELYEKGVMVGNFEFRPFNYYQEKNNTLFVGSASDFPEEFKVIHRINNPDGSEAMRVVEKR